MNGAQALNRSYQRGPKSLRATAVLNQAISGTEQHDLSKLVAGLGKFTAALNVHEQQLSELIVNFNAFFRAFADGIRGAASGGRSAAELADGDRCGLHELNEAFPPIAAFSTEILPGVKNTNAMIRAALPWIAQIQASLAPSELGGVARASMKQRPRS